MTRRRDPIDVELDEAVLDLRRALGVLREHERQRPVEIEAIRQAVISDLRAWCPMSVAPLSVLAAPTEPICDPRRPSGMEPDAA